MIVAARCSSCVLSKPAGPPVKVALSANDRSIISFGLANATTSAFLSRRSLDEGGNAGELLSCYLTPIFAPLSALHRRSISG